jgi:YHS domain-containing protein
MNLNTTASLALRLSVLIALSAAPGVATMAGNSAQLVNVDKHGVILDGYDPVAFFTDNKPVKGSDAFQSSYGGAIYHFASAEHKATFDKDPAKYEPQFGAFCAYAVSLGHTAPIDVETFSIIDGRLVVQHNSRAVSLWNKDPQGNLKKADTYWPAVAKNGGKQIKIDQ